MKASLEEALSKALDEPDTFLSLVLTNQVRLTKTVLKTLFSKITKASAALFCEALVKGVLHALECLDKAHPAPASTAGAANLESFKTPSPPRRKRRRQIAAKAGSHNQNEELSAKDGGNENDSSMLKNRQQIMSGLRGCVLLLQLAVSHPRRAFETSGLLPVMQNLHDRLVMLEDDIELQESIAELCELWWREGLEGRESLIAQSLPFLLSRSLTSNRKVDVHRVYSMKEALSLFDFLDVSIEDLKHLLIRSVVTPSYLRSAEGRRFISFLFGLNPQLVKELNALMRSQIPFGRKSILEAYGEILYRAWKAAAGPNLVEIENSCIQGLMEGAILASSKALSSASRKVLEGFISQRAEAGVEAMLFRLQEPLLFRSLQVANSNVRRNALLLLVDMFPLQDPDASKEDKEILFEKQFMLIEKLLLDPCPDVRSIAVEGACRILRLFWEVVPSAITVRLLTKIMDEMSNDHGSSSTRLAVLEGITYLLEYPQSHEILKVLLPRLAPMLNDPVVTVRAAAVELLLVIKDIRGISFYKIARLDSILSSLASDSDAVARRLTRLLIPSYFPSKAPVLEACNRCCTLIKRSPQAGARFCSLILAEGVPHDSLLELVKFLSGLALPKSDLDPQHQEGVLLALSELCSSMASSGHLKQAMGDQFTGKYLMSLLKGAASPRARTSIVRLASFLPPKDVPELVKYCGDLVSDCAKNHSHLDSCHEIRAVNSFVLSWGGFEDLLEALVDMLSRISHPDSSADKQKSSSKKRSKPKIGWSGKPKKRSSPRQSNDESSFTAAVGAAWHVQNLLAECDTREALLSCGVLQRLLSCLKYLAEYAMKKLGNTTTQALVSSAVTAYANLSIHLSLEQKKDSTVRTSTGRRKRHRVDVSATEPVASAWQDGIEGVFEELVSWASEMLDSIREGKLEVQPCSKRRHSESLSSSTCVKSGDFFMHPYVPQALKLVAATLRSVLEALNLGLVSGNTLKSKVMKLASSFITSVQAGTGGESTQEVLDDVSACLKASASYAGKLLFICMKAGGGHSVDGWNLAHDFLDTLAIIEQRKAGSSFALLPALRSWIPDILGAVTCKDLPEDAATSASSSKDTPRIWLSHLAMVSFQAMDMSDFSDEQAQDASQKSNEDGTSSQSEAEEKSVPLGIDLLKTVLRFLQKVDRQVVQGFIDLLVQYAASCLECRDNDRCIGSLDLICRKILGFKLPEQRGLSIGLTEASLTGLKNIDTRISETFGLADNQKLQIVQKLLRIVYSSE